MLPDGKSTINFDKAVEAVAKALAKERSEAERVTHHNDAKRILWHLLDERGHTSRVMR